MRRPSILEQDDAPTPPVRTDHLEKTRVSLLVPIFCNQQNDISALNVDGAIKNSSSIMAGDRNTYLFLRAPITTVKRGCLTYDGFIPHENYGTREVGKPLFRLPLVGRQVRLLSPTVWRRRFHRIL